MKNFVVALLALAVMLVCCGSSYAAEVLTLEELTEAVDQLNENVINLDERLQRVENQVGIDRLAVSTQQATTAKTSTAKTSTGNVAKVAGVSDYGSTVRPGYGSSGTAAYASAPSNPVSYGSTGSAASYGQNSASYGSAPVQTVRMVSVRSRGPGLLGGPGLFNRNASYQQVQTTSNRRAYCVDENGNQVPCN